MASGALPSRVELETPSAMSESHLEVARALIDAIGRGDAQAAAAVYHEDAAVYRNFDGRTIDKAETAKVLRFLTSKVEGLRYDDIRLAATADGFVQEHVLVGTAPSGAPVRCPACLVAEVRDGTIFRLREYLDSAALAPLLG